MLIATIVKDKAGTYHIRTSRKGPQTGGDVEFIDTLTQREGEYDHMFEERCVRFVRDLKG